MTLGTEAWGESAGGKIDQSQSISNVCVRAECVGSEEATALSCPAPSVLQDVLHQQDWWGGVGCAGYLT